MAPRFMHFRAQRSARMLAEDDSVTFEETLDYHGFWTIGGQLRNLLYNGFHPVIPWAAFVLAGIWLGRHDLTDAKLRWRIGIGAALVVAVTESLSALLVRGVAGGDRNESS